MEKISYEMGSFASKVLIETVGFFFAKSFSLLLSLDSDPLFSTVVALYSLLLLYLPRVLLCFTFSPVLISTAILLSILLRLGAIQSVEQREHLTKSTEQQEIGSSHIVDHRWVKWETKKEKKEMETVYSVADSFVEWNVRAPLEVIYEEYEGEEEEEEESRQMGIDRMLYLSIYYPESDSDSSSDDDFPAMSMCFRWDKEEREGLIEIPLDGKETVFQIEEENLIEIDI